MAAVRTASPPLLFALDAPDQGFVCLNSPQRRSLGVTPTTRLASRRDATFMRFFEGDTKCEPLVKNRVDYSGTYASVCCCDQRPCKPLASFGQLR
jgi:hypothetical protein